MAPIIFTGSKMKVKKVKTLILFQELETAEEYENLKILSKIPFLKNIKGSVTFFVCWSLQIKRLFAEVVRILTQKER